MVHSGNMTKWPLSLLFIVTLVSGQEPNSTSDWQSALNEVASEHISKIRPKPKTESTLINIGDGEEVLFFNFTDLDEQLESASNYYGISAALSGDILSLKSAIDSMDGSLCKNHSLQLMKGLFSGEMWAMKMYDASAKSATGLLWGDKFQLGNFDECLSVKSDIKQNINAQYCLANIIYKLKKPMGKSNRDRFGPREDIHWAICAPDACSAEQIQEFLSKLLKLSGYNADVSVPDNYCHRNEVKVDKKDIGFMSLIAFFSFLLVTCTFYHIYVHYKYRNSEFKETIMQSSLLAFSIARNLNKIFSVKQHNSLGLDAIAGIRTITMVLIIVGHALLFIIGGPVFNSGFYDEMLTRVENAIFLSNPLLVDTFLFISAFLLCRLLLSELDKRKGKLNVLPIYIFRYIRVTSSYIIVIAFYATLLTKIDQGPLWDSRMALEQQRCQESWWVNILYINNYVQTDKLCMFQSWYLSVDTQLFFLAPAIIYPLWKWRRFGEFLLLTTTLVSMLIPFVVTYVNELDPTLMPFSKEVIDVSVNFYFKEAYMKTHMRACTYFAGLSFGYILYRIQTSGYKMPLTVKVFGWITCVIGMTSSIFTVTVFFQPTYIYNPLDAAFYNSLHHVAWAIANGWLLIACATDNGGFVNKVFTWKPLIPLSRLTYCAYLVNGLVELHSLGTLRNSIHMNIYNLTVITLSHVAQTFVGALLVCLMFESPIHRIEKILLNSFGKRGSENKS